MSWNDWLRPGRVVPVDMDTIVGLTEMLREAREEIKRLREAAKPVAEQSLYQCFVSIDGDAQRFRWLRDQGSFSVDRQHRDPYNKNWRGEFCLFTIASQHVYGDSVGEAVDAAMEKTRR